jgi:hypothetical protein
VAGLGIAALRRVAVWLLLLAVAAVPACSAEESPMTLRWNAGFAEADFMPTIGEAMHSGFDRLSVEALRRWIGETLDVHPSAVCFAASHTTLGPAINERAIVRASPDDLPMIDIRSL